MVAYGVFLLACACSVPVWYGVRFAAVGQAGWSLGPTCQWTYKVITDMKNGCIWGSIAAREECGGNIGVSTWGALLSACCDCRNVELGKLAARKAIELEPRNVGIYVELSNLYANAGLWEEINKLREVMKDRSFEKDVGSTWVEQNSWNDLHKFRMRKYDLIIMIRVKEGNLIFLWAATRSMRKPSDIFCWTTISEV